MKITADFQIANMVHSWDTEFYTLNTETYLTVHKII